jgi:hypothetical protein
MAVYRPELTAFREQLASIRDQTYTNWFCVLTADSPLSEITSAREITEFVSDPRFHWYENEKRLGFKGNFAHAIARAANEGASAIACSDQDDIWYSNKLELLVHALVGKPRLSLVHGDMDVLRDGEKLLRSAWDIERRGIGNTSPSSLFLRNTVTGAAMLMDAELARLYPEVPNEIEYHDHFYALMASFHGGIYPVNERVHAYRQHTGNVLGVMPYRGFLDGHSVSAMFERRREALEYWQNTRRLVKRVQALGLPLTRFQELAFIRSSDLGLLLFGYGIASLADPEAARSCFALGLGKLMDVMESRLGPSRSHES